MRWCYNLGYDFDELLVVPLVAVKITNVGWSYRLSFFVKCSKSSYGAASLECIPFEVL